MRTALAAIGAMLIASLSHAQTTLCPQPRIGSWGQRVKVSNVATTDDPVATVEAAIRAGQNFIIYPVGRCYQWNTFGDLLRAADAAGIDVYAAIGNPEATGQPSVWFAEDLPVLDGACSEGALPVKDCSGAGDSQALRDCERAWMLQWLDMYKRCGAALSAVAADHPCLAGLVINDFDGHVESPIYPGELFGAKFTHDEVGEIRDQCHSVDQDFGLWPTCYHESFGAMLGNGYVLGCNYGVHLFEDESMSVALSFDLPPGDPPPAQAILRFFHSDSREDCSPFTIYKRVFVNGTELTSGLALGSPESVAGDQHVQYAETDVASLMIPGTTNTIEFLFDPDTPIEDLHCGSDCAHNGCGSIGMFWRVWGVSMETIGPGGVSVLVDDFSEFYNVNATSNVYAYAGCAGRFDTTTIANTDPRCPWATLLPDDPALGLTAGRLIATPSRDFSIHDAVDGVVVPFYRMDSTATDICSFDGVDYTVPLFVYSSDYYEALLRQTKKEFGDTPLMELQLGLPLARDFDLVALEDQTRIAAEIADATGWWNMPLGVALLDDRVGLFADHSPDDAVAFDWMGTTTHKAQFFAYWPSRQLELEGWYHEWVIDPWLHDTEIRILVADNEDDVPSVERWRKVIYQEGSLASPIWEDELGGDDDHLEVLDSTVIGTTPVVVRMELIDGVGSITASTYFAIEKSDGTTIEFDPGEVEFRPGASDLVLDTYDMQSSVTLDLRRTLADIAEPFGQLDIDDFFAYLDLVAAGDPAADLDGNGVFDANDFFTFLDWFAGATCP